MIQQQIQVSNHRSFKMSKFILGIGQVCQLGIGKQVFLLVAVLLNIIKASIIMLSFLTDCYMMEVLSGICIKILPFRYIYTASNIQEASWAAVGAQTETRVLQPKIGSEASLHDDFI